MVTAKKKETTAPSKPDNSDAAGRLYKLFQSNQRSAGQFDPKTGKMHTLYRGPTVEDFTKHVEGRVGIGAVPIDDKSECAWAAIDIDNHDGAGEDIPIAPIAAKISELKLPLVACRSKSGGVHVYLFLAKPIGAARVKGLMSKWATILGYPGVEIFPKQAKLLPSKEGGLQLGNWINLPYLGGDATVRYAYSVGKKMGLGAFLDLAEKSRATETELMGAALLEHAQAPPCVQKMMTDGVESGNRNEAMYNTVIYLKRLDPDGYEGRAQEMNGTMFTKPLPRNELLRTISSAARPDYSYRCNEEPIRSLCDKQTCIKRKFGITKEQFETLDALGVLPAFTEMIKYVSDPVRWEIKVDGVKITNLSTETLYDFRSIRMLITERLTMGVPLIKPVEWERIIFPMMKEARIIDTPDDASVAGVIRTRLREFAARTDLTSKGQVIADRRALLRGLPVVQVVDGERCVVFRQPDFINYLKRTKAEELKGVALWFAVKDLGVQHKKMRAGSGDAPNINVWTIPIEVVLQEQPDKIEGPKYESKL